MAKDEVLRFLTVRRPCAFGIKAIARALKLKPQTIQGQVKSLYKEGKLARTSRGLYCAFTEDDKYKVTGRNLADVYGQ